MRKDSRGGCVGLFKRMCLVTVGRDSSVGTATRYGLDGPGIECWWGWNFPLPFRLNPGPTQPPVQWEG